MSQNQPINYIFLAAKIRENVRLLAYLWHTPLKATNQELWKRWLEHLVQMQQSIQSFTAKTANCAYACLFSAAKAAQERQMSVCLSVCLSVSLCVTTSFIANKTSK